MAAIYAGNDGSALTLESGYPKKSRDAHGKWTLAYLYWCAASAAESLLPASGSACSETGHTSLVCVGVSITPKPGAPKMVSVEITYGPATTNYVQTHEAGDIVKELRDGGFREVSLKDPDITTLISEAEANAQWSAGKRTLPVSTVEYTYTEHLASFSWTEANCTTNLGKIGTPEGMSAVTVNKWLLTGYSVRQEGALIVKTRTWTYSAIPWTTETTT